MFLGPQHFQQSERVAQARTAQLLRSLQPLGYGFTVLSVDRSALARGEFALLACEGILPDGLSFSFHDPDELPASRALGPAFETRRERLGVYLAVPERRAGGVAVSDEGQIDGRQTRFRRRLLAVQDDSPQGEARQIALAAINLRLLFEGDSNEGHSVLKIAEVTRSGAGAYELADDYVAPALSLGGAPSLVAVVRRMVEVVIARAGELAYHRRSRTQGLVEFSVSEVASYLMLHTLNGHIPGLLHALEEGRDHPQAVFLQLAGLCGQLCTLHDAVLPKDLPRYRHDAPFASFHELEAKLRVLLGTAIATRYIPIPLSKSGERLQVGTIPEAVGEGTKVYLAVLSTMPAERVLREVPMMAKVASQGRIAGLIAQALPGIKLTYLAVPPSEIPTQPGGTYFELDQGGAEWGNALKARTLAIYLPPTFADARTEFLAVKG
jgi:type VI secretion system protein ImpJ